MNIKKIDGCGIGGKAYIGDPCYVIPDDLWMDIVKAWFAPEIDGDTIVVEIDGFEFVMGGTAYGDGCYDAKGVVGHCPVDSGSLSVIPFALVEKWGKGEDGDGIVADIKEGSFAEIEDGVLTVGGIVIDTNDNYDEEDEEDGR